jgi:hypothetical protein
MARRQPQLAHFLSPIETSARPSVANTVFDVVPMRDIWDSETPRLIRSATGFALGSR